MSRTSEAVKEAKWEEHFSTYGTGISMFRTKETTDLVLEGIPGKLRNQVWMTLSGAVHDKNQAPGYYARMVRESMGKKDQAGFIFGHFFGHLQMLTDFLNVRVGIILLIHLSLWEGFLS